MKPLPRVLGLHAAPLAISALAGILAGATGYTIHTSEAAAYLRRGRSWT